MIELKYPIVELANTLNKSPQSIHKLCNEVKIPINSEKGRSFLSPESIRKYLERLKYNYPKKVISFQACKGGVGKTSLCYNIAIRAAQYGAKVLAIDLDMQAHLTLALLDDDSLKCLVWQDVLEGKKIEDAIIKIQPHMHLIPSHLDNSYLDKKILQSTKVVYSDFVKKHLDKVRNQYDIILIDCAPALSNINTAVSIASDKILVPVNPDIFSFDGVEKTLSELKGIQDSFSTDLDVTIILNRFDAREKNSLDIIANLKNSYGQFLSQTVVVSSTEIKNAIAKKENIFNSKNKPHVCKDLDSITREILEINN